MKDVGCEYSSLLWTNAQKGDDLCLPQSMNCVGCQFQRHGQLWPELLYCISQVGLAVAVLQFFYYFTCKPDRLQRKSHHSFKERKLTFQKALCIKILTLFPPFTYSFTDLELKLTCEENVCKRELCPSSGLDQESLCQKIWLEVVFLRFKLLCHLL